VAAAVLLTVAVALDLIVYFIFCMAAKVKTLNWRFRVFPLLRATSAHNAIAVAARPKARPLSQPPAAQKI
jgi:hypothetical protein